MVARLHAGEDTEHCINSSTQGETTILRDIIDPQPSRTSDISVVQSIPHQCDSCLLYGDEPILLSGNSFFPAYYAQYFAQNLAI